MLLYTFRYTSSSSFFGMNE